VFSWSTVLSNWGWEIFLPFNFNFKLFLWNTISIVRDRIQQRMCCMINIVCLCGVRCVKFVKNNMKIKTKGSKIYPIPHVLLKIAKITQCLVKLRVQCYCNRSIDRTDSSRMPKEIVSLKLDSILTIRLYTNWGTWPHSSP
jgi:hypothetical protein